MFVFCLYAPICLYGNIPDLRFIASNGEICLYLSRKVIVKQLRISNKTALQRGGILSLHKRINPKNSKELSFAMRDSPTLFSCIAPPFPA